MSEEKGKRSASNDADFDEEAREKILMGAYSYSDYRALQREFGMPSTGESLRKMEERAAQKIKKLDGVEKQKR